MPIYAYRCSSCGHQKDVLQKLSDAPLTDCPACGAATFAKQVTAAGFQLKGSGWYATDFKGGGTSKPAADTDSASSGEASKSESGKGDSGKSDGGGSGGDSGGSTTASAGGTACGGSCACH